VPRVHWLDEAKKKVIFDYHEPHLLEGSRRFAFLLLNVDAIVARPSSVSWVLHRRLRPPVLLRDKNGKTVTAE